ncbi:UV radiation resistance protein and autophagy-related subunit 14-domain-containing protein [Mycena olivaceomarginata]|nr:UV radiation resistance protein and autophagy-related subunit 14-domain-containing protein [Mycena olivaceomarginata]
MKCKTCELQQRQFFCTDCICAHTRDFRMKMEHSVTDRDEQMVKATTALRSVEASRALRADVTQVQTRIDELLNALARLRKDAEDKRDRLGRLWEALAQRRHTLAAATSGTLPTPTAIPASASHPALAAPLASLTNLSSHITAARVGLIQELVVVFNVAEVGRRPPLGGNAGSQGDWSIGDLILPVPGDMPRYPPEHINAVLSHTVHFLGLLSFYLGVKLPFTIRWEGGKLGVGIPWIEPGVGGWEKWTASYPLHLSLSSTRTQAPSPVTPRYSSPPTRPSLSQFLSPTKCDIPNTLQPQPPPAPESDRTHFTTAFAMLLYDVLYIAHTQGLAIPLAQAGDVLSNLVAVCCAPELGRRSHSCAGYPHTRLPAPAPGSSGFRVDFAHVLQATASVGRSPALQRHVGANVMSERWEGAEQSREGWGSEERNREPKQDEEDGWDLVSEDGN